MKVKHHSLKILSSLGIVGLLVSGLPAAAQAEVVPEIALSKINTSSNFLGSKVNDGLKVTSKQSLSSTNHYRLNVFDKTTNEFVASCIQDDPTESCQFEFRDTKNVSEFKAGIHDFQVYLEESTDPFAATPSSIGELGKIIAKSNVVSWERKPLNLTLSTKSPVVD